MRPIQMVDTRTQYHKIKPEVDNAVLQVMESSVFINGKPVQDFATHLSEYLRVKHVVPCANGTDALQIAMMALGLQPGDEVIIPSFTYIAPVEVIALLRLVPVFVEVDPKTFCMDATVLEKAITSKTKAIIPVHLYGQSAPMEAIMAIAEKNNLFVIEDNAQAIGCDYIFSDGTKKKTGTIGHIGITSFHPSKNLGAFGDGGAVFANDTGLAAKIKMIANHGQGEKKFYHQLIGCNSRLDTMQAAILDIKLNHLDEYTVARNRVADFYDKTFKSHPKIIIPSRTTYSSHVFHQYTILIEGGDSSAMLRDGLIRFLADSGIPSKVYYPVPGHKQKMAEHLNGNLQPMPVTEWLTDRVLSLPMHTELEEDELKFIINKVVEYFNQ
jgi:UDP-2-acetamido-2-deoxy-ribo-hexuluronate aminotransferase